MNYKLLLLFAAALCASVVHAARFCDPESRFCLLTGVSRDKKSMVFQVSTTISSGWIGLGFGKPVMDGADMLFIYSFDNKAYFIDGTGAGASVRKDQKQDYYTIKRLPQAPNGMPSSYSVHYEIKRPFQGTSQNIEMRNETIDMIWAISESPLQSSAMPTTKHSDKGTFRINLYSQNTIATSGMSTARIALIHGVLMIVAWIVCTPLAVFVARYCKSLMGVWWFRSHVTLMLIAFALNIAAFGLMVAYQTKHFNTPHKAMGLVVVLFCVVQTVLGFVIDRKFNPNRYSIPWYDKLHWWLGRVLAVLAIACIFLGIADSGFTSSTSWFIACAVLLGVIFISFVIGQVKLGQTHHSEKPATSPNAYSPQADPYYYSQENMQESHNYDYAPTNYAPNNYDHAPNNYAQNNYDYTLKRDEFGFHIEPPEMHSY